MNPKFQKFVNVSRLQATFSRLSKKMNLKIIIAYSSISINNKYRENTENVCVNKPVSLLNILWEG